MEADSQMPDVHAVAAAILRYLDAHPLAADTAEGIQRWWLLPQYGEVSLHTVEAALAQLEHDGEVRKLDPAWSPATYQRAGGGSA
jgi:hypothetical protein